MHGHLNVKFVSFKQANKTNQYGNNKEKLYKTIASLRYNKIYRVPSWSCCSQAVSKPVWHIPLLCVQWKTADDGQRNCPKHVEFCSKSFSQAVSKPVWHIPLLCVQWKTPDDGQKKFPKHVEFYSNNKFEKLVHLVGFIVRTPSVTLTQKSYSRNQHPFHPRTILCCRWRHYEQPLSHSWLPASNPRGQYEKKKHLLP